MLSIYFPAMLSMMLSIQCPYCEHELTAEEIVRLHRQLLAAKRWAGKAAAPAIPPKKPEPKQKAKGKAGKEESWGSWAERMVARKQE